MLGNKQVLDALNARLSEELGAIAQYEAHRADLAVQQYPKLVEYLQERIDDERKHFNLLSERIRFLGGEIAAGAISPVNVGWNVSEMHRADLAAENDAITKYRADISLCIQVGDHGTRTILEGILEDEEDHARDLEAQLTRIAQMSLENYLGSKI